MTTEPPSAPTHCLVFRLPNASRQVRCVPGQDGGSPQTFFLRVHGSGGLPENRAVSGEEPRFLLDDFETEADFNVTVCAVSKGFPDSPVCAETLVLHKGKCASKTG